MPGLDITPRIAAGQQLIQGYGDGGFRIAGAFHSGAVLVRPDRTTGWTMAVPDAISADSLVDLTTDATGARILVVGCGARFVPPPPGLADALRARGVALEWMDTGAACRTFNVLLIEGRDVAAALIAVP
ncbi:MAG: Mth938-like domain-containing protein [Rhodospirillales bacterium]